MLCIDEKEMSELEDKLRTLSVENECLEEKVDSLESMIAEKVAEIEDLKKQIQGLTPKKEPKEEEIPVVQGIPAPAPVPVQHAPAPAPKRHSGGRGAPVIRNAAGGAAGGAIKGAVRKFWLFMFFFFIFIILSNRFYTVGAVLPGMDAGEGAAAGAAVGATGGALRGLRARRMGR